MKILVVGLGSMGKRRLRLLKNAYENVEIVGVDLSEERRNQAVENFRLETSSALKEAFEKYKYTAAFICSSPLSHANNIEECLRRKINVFSEISLSDEKYNDLLRLADENKVKVFLSSTPMYRNEIKYITQKVQSQNKPVTYNYHVGQYLPDWHPWENYKDFFVHDKRTNGCRELFAIELGWIINAYGNIRNVSKVKSKNSLLDIDYPDNYIVILEHETGHKGVLIVDIVSRVATRKLEVIGEDLHLFWDGTPDSLHDYNLDLKKIEAINTYEQINHNEQYSNNIIENAYLEEINDFFSYLAGDSIPKYSFQKHKQVLQLIDIIESE